MEEVICFSPAKINLGLEILGVREDGYHELVTLYQSIDLCDKIIFKVRTDGHILLTGNDPLVAWNKTNLVFRAAEILKQKTGARLGAEILVEKNIPAGRGLGGGSSNAAATLLTLNRLWDIGYGPEELFALAAELGSDVSFFLIGGLCLGLGRGERILPLEEPTRWWVVLILPDFSVSTALAYQEYDLLERSLTSTNKESKIIQFLEAKDISLIRQFKNDLEAVAFKIYPQLAEIKQEINSSGAELSLMSGSGSAVFGLYMQEDLAREAAARLGEKYRTILVATVSREEYRRKLGTGASPNW
ncbi:MAG: 4-(cytidine 5'-diphospho)-2-C-methyl-D-erythritol kinase [Candidatus Aminicenantes bacterium]|nr:4-(cytidine 5'-diphospho)-2-C-methyl-D-erythritol kinase [Candidatus Aminicenantes bacterium]